MSGIKRILVMGAGGAPGNNFIRSLRQAPDNFYVVGTDINRYHLEWPELDRSYLVPRCTEEEYIPALRRIIRQERIQFVHAQPDVGVSVLSEHRDHLPAATFLPARETVRILQNKLESARRWRECGIHTAPTFAVRNGEELRRAADVLGLPLWLRATEGAGARGSTLVPRVEVGIHWLRYWQARESGWEFIAQQYLPGRDYAFQSLWRDGELVTSQARLRLEYIFPHLAPSGRTGTPIVARTVHRDDLNQIAAACVLAIDSGANGIFCVDLREDRNGRPVPTEINAGRFFTTSYFFTSAGSNMPYYYVKLGFGEPIPDLPKFNAVPEGLYWIRHIDCPAVLIREGDFRSVDWRRSYARVPA